MLIFLILQVEIWAGKGHKARQLVTRPNRLVIMTTNLNWEWDLEIQHNPQELGEEEPYDIFFFLGPVPPSPSEWQHSPSRLFGRVVSYADSTTTEYRFMNNYIKDRGGSEQKDDDVVPYLRKHLSWRVKKVSHRSMTLQIN